MCVMESARSILTTAGPPVSSLTGTPVCGYSRDHNTARGLVATTPRGRTHRWQSHGSLVTQSACTPSRGAPGVATAAAVNQLGYNHGRGPGYLGGAGVSPCSRACRTGVYRQLTVTSLVVGWGEGGEGRQQGLHVGSPKSGGPNRCTSTCSAQAVTPLVTIYCHVPCRPRLLSYILSLPSASTRSRRWRARHKCVERHSAHHPCVEGLSPPSHRDN